jgi:hypothetical protein
MPWLAATLVALTPAVATLVGLALKACLVEASLVQTLAALMALREARRATACLVLVGLSM